MKPSFFQAGRVLLQVLLIAVFFRFFGLPAIQKFEAREVKIYYLNFLCCCDPISQVMVVQTTKGKKEGIPAPVQTWKKQAVQKYLQCQ